MGKIDRNTRYERKVILLKYKNKKESLILSKTVKRRREKLALRVQCNTKIRKSLNKFKLNKEYPVFKTQLRERIVPCCFRAKCAAKKKHMRIHQQQDYKHGEAEQGVKHQIKMKRAMSLSSISSIEMIDESNNSFGYENISSDSLSSYTDDEIENLMKSTRKRMKDLDNGCKLFPRQHSSSTPVSNRCEDINLSINSLDTFILEADDSKEYLEMYDLKNEDYSPTMSPEDSKYKSFITNNNKELIHIFKDMENHHENHFQSDDKIDDIVIIKQERNNLEHKHTPCHTTENINNYPIKQEL